MKVRHTPGPWRLTEQPTPNEFSKQIVGQETMEGISKFHGIHICNVFVQPGRENEANARLIAAAPEMLDILKKFQAGTTGAEREFLYSEIGTLIARIEGGGE